MSSKLPPKDDPQRSQQERDALIQREKATRMGEALSEGKLPTTSQITSAIQSVQESEVIHESARGLTPLGKKVFADTEQLLETTKKVLEEKNAGEELQNIVYYDVAATKAQQQKLPEELPEDLKKRVGDTAPTARNLLKDSANQTLNLARLLIATPEFRRLINDLHSVIQDALTTALTPADDTRSESQASPESHGAAVGTSPQASRESQGAAGGTGEKSPQQAIDETKDTARGAVHPALRKTAEATEPYVQSFSEGRSSLQDTTKEGARDFVGGVRERVSNINLPKEKRDIIVSRFKDLMIEAHKSKEYQDALENLIKVTSTLSEHTQQVAGKIAKTADETASESEGKPALKIAEQNVKQLVENFASHRSLDPLIDALNQLIEKVKQDEELHNYLKDLQTFVVKSLRDTEFVQQTDYTALGSDQIERGRKILLGNYGEITDRIKEESRKFNDALQEDRTTRQLVHDLETLTQDLFLDDAGKPTFKLELVKDFARILPRIGEGLKYIALPRIENSDDEYDYIFDNIVLHVSEIVPKHVHMSLTADIDLDRPEQDIVRNTIMIDISKLHADARNIAFYYKKKKGIVNMMDVGLVDFAIPEDAGLRIHAKVLLRLPTENSRLALEVLESSTRIQELKIRLHDTKHDFLYKLVAPIVQSRIRTQVEHLINERISSAIKYLEQQISRVQANVSEMQRQRRATETQHQPGGVSGDKHKQRAAWESDAYSGSSQPQPVH